MCFFFAVPPSGQNAKRPFKFLLFDFSMRRKVGHQNLILLFSIPSGANSFVCRVKFNSRQEKFCSQFVVVLSTSWKMATTRYSGDKFQAKKMSFAIDGHPPPRREDPPP